MRPLGQFVPAGFLLGERMIISWLNHAVDWAELNDIPLTIFRDDDGDWCAKIEIRDGRGWFSFALKSFEPTLVKVDEFTTSGKPKKRRETPDEYHSRIISSLARAVQKARAARIEEFAGVDPRRQSRSAGSLAA